ncbi:MAG: flagellar export chaperone FlgN [Planctomycetes bacterium]|nr:flagellar export chaperone FlgN [Planctomycetota bacterium]
MNARQLVQRLEANLQAELGAKNREIETLARQEAAIAARDVEALASASAELAEILQRGTERAAARSAILAELGRALGLPAPVRLGALADALDERGAVLHARRAELRERCAVAMKAGRRVAALVRMHAGIVDETLGRFLAPDPSGAPLGCGSLVDAEA